MCERLWGQLGAQWFGNISPEFSWFIEKFIWDDYSYFQRPSCYQYQSLKGPISCDFPLKGVRADRGPYDDYRGESPWFGFGENEWRAHRYLGSRWGIHWTYEYPDVIYSLRGFWDLDFRLPYKKGFLLTKDGIFS